MKYIVLLAERAPDLAFEVNAHIAAGWEPIGGVAYDTCHQTWEDSRKGHQEAATDHTWAQAMVHRGWPE